MPDRRLLKKVDKLGMDIDACADALRAIKKIGSPEWLKLNDKLVNLIAKREKILAEIGKNA